MLETAVDLSVFKRVSLEDVNKKITAPEWRKNWELPLADVIHAGPHDFYYNIFSGWLLLHFFYT